MSKLFFDKLIAFEEVEKVIKKHSTSKEEREELWQLVDEMIHHRVLGCVLDKLPANHHQEFLEKFHQSPHDESLIGYLTEKIGENAEELIKQEIGSLAYELLQEIQNSNSKSEIRKSK